MMTEWVGSVCPSWYTYMSSSHNSMDILHCSGHQRVDMWRLQDFCWRGVPSPTWLMRSGIFITLQFHLEACFCGICGLCVLMGGWCDVYV